MSIESAFWTTWRITVSKIICHDIFTYSEMEQYICSQFLLLKYQISSTTAFFSLLYVNFLFLGKYFINCILMHYSNEWNIAAISMQHNCDIIVTLLQCWLTIDIFFIDVVLEIFHMFASSLISSSFCINRIQGNCSRVHSHEWKCSILLWRFISLVFII